MFSSTQATVVRNGNGTAGRQIDRAHYLLTAPATPASYTPSLPPANVLASVSVTAPITGNGTAGNPLAMSASNGTTNGYLTSTDWTTFNNKLTTVAVTVRLNGNGTAGSTIDIAEQGATAG